MFAGGATVEAAEDVTGADLDTLGRLVEEPARAPEEPGTPRRLGMLETIRAYAGERFEAAHDGDAVDERHYRHYLTLARVTEQIRRSWVEPVTKSISALPRR